MNSVRHIFGPVPSRRLGASLGVDLVRPKTCSFDCVYCQLGQTTCKTTERRSYVPMDEVLSELECFLEGGEADYITLSGSGEPTLSTSLGHVLAAIRRLTDIPTAVLTNSSMMSSRDVRQEVALADLVIPSLDSATDEGFRTINRPHPDLSIAPLVRGLADFRREYGGQIWLEIMVVKGFNDRQDEVDALADAIPDIDPERIQLNTVLRPPAESFARPCSDERMAEIARVLGAEVIAESGGGDFGHRRNAADNLISLLERRPCTLLDICGATGLHPNEALKHLQRLRGIGAISVVRSDGRTFYVRTPECGGGA